MQHIKQLAMTAAVLAAAGALSACGSLSHDIAANGGNAGKLVWPSATNVGSLHQGGTSPTLASLRQVHVGMNKDQIMSLIGPPQFNEGWGVREWDYLFQIKVAGSTKATRCQYKILFNDNDQAGSFYWKPSSCANLLKAPAPKAKIVMVPKKEATPVPAVHTLFALFAFDKSGLEDIRAAGRVRLYLMLGELTHSAKGGASIMVNGYAGRLGSTAYNKTLSQERADTVRGYLVAHGVPADAIKANGRGASSPIAQCHEHSRAALIACLAPNRRVEIVVRQPKATAATGSDTKPAKASDQGDAKA